MADQSYGLRFDIYERVHLSEDVIGIEELEEIELFPKIQVVPGEEYAALRGHLLLSGLYRGDGETRDLEHWIPVEITIPLSRVNRLEDITVEIENFDVDLLSSRSLNITGVLSLQGVETSSLLPENDSWKDREFTTAHVVPDIRGEEREAEETVALPQLEEEVRSQSPFAWESPEPQGVLETEEPPSLQVPQFTPWQSFPEELLSVQKRSADEQEEVLTWTEDVSAFQEPGSWADKEYEASPAEEPLNSPEDQDSHAWFKGELRPFAESQQIERFSETLEESADQAPTSYDANEAGTASPHEAVGELSSELENVEGIEADNPPNAQPEEKKEMKIALGSKKSNEAEDRESFGLTKLISSSRISPEPLEDFEDSLAGFDGSETADGEELRWKNLFINSREDQTPFRKVRLVIVQREETLDDIAQRYHLSSRELQLYNRLSEHHLAEGQILYIP
ncbi:LysM peptidoglycan-binding domain-containing protein [Paenibacillus macerans]|uniref:LysM peptidoglycan-binding domain-containing protein n=1 Tax=Paenibacillus macerans TaxID=44252 RepID=UPI003D312776